MRLQQSGKVCVIITYAHWSKDEKSERVAAYSDSDGNVYDLNYRLMSGSAKTLAMAFLPMPKPSDKTYKTYQEYEAALITWHEKVSVYHILNAD